MIDYQYIVRINKKLDLEILNMPFKEFFSKDISPMYSKLEPNSNKVIIHKLLEEEYENKNIYLVLNMKFKDWFDIFCYKRDFDSIFNFENEVIKNIGWNKNDVGLFAFHQANEILLRTLAKRCRIPLEKMPITLKYFGNTSSASVPLTLVLQAENNRALDNWDKVVMCGFGNGLACAAAALSLKDTYFSTLHEI